MLTAEQPKHSVMRAEPKVSSGCVRCGHCKSLAPEWEKLAKSTKGLLNVAAVDADANKQIGGVRGLHRHPPFSWPTAPSRQIG